MQSATSHPFWDCKVSGVWSPGFSRFELRFLCSVRSLERFGESNVPPAQVAMIPFLFAAFAALSFALLVWQWLVALRFPLHQRRSDTSFQPPVTLLKPLK